MKFKFLYFSVNYLYIFTMEHDIFGMPSCQNLHVPKMFDLIFIPKTIIDCHDFLRVYFNKINNLLKTRF